MAKVTIKCARCRGTGTKDRDGRDPPCPVCDGVGTVFVSEPFITCGRCGGDGTKDRDGRDPVCPICSGTGVVFAGDIREY